MTDQDIKNKLFSFWANYRFNAIGYRLNKFKADEMNWILDNFRYKTIREIKALMIKDGIELSEINKIIGM